MTAARIPSPGNVEILEVSDSPVTERDVLVRVYASGICGTDVHIFRGDYMGSYPIIPGHEFAGVVEAVGSSVSRIRVGDRVAIEPNVACDNCHACLNNRQNFCENWNGIGVTLPGGMAELVAVPEKAVFDIGALPFPVAAFVEPLACVLHGVERARFRLADRVLIVGAGPIGILLTKMILLQGAFEITQVDKNKNRLALAEESGASHVLSSVDSVKEEAFDVVVDATGVPSLMERTLGFARYGGTILLFGVPPQKSTVTFPAFPIFRKGLTILSSFTSVRNSVQAVRLLSSGAIDVSSLVSHTLPLKDLRAGLNLMETGNDGALKVQISPNA
jgi:D-arabinitol dehydrogenase (NADP+)